MEQSYIRVMVAAMDRADRVNVVEWSPIQKLWQKSRGVLVNALLGQLDFKFPSTQLLRHLSAFLVANLSTNSFSGILSSQV